MAIILHSAQNVLFAGALCRLLQQGNLKPIIAERIPLDEVARAHELLGSGR